MTWNEEQSEIGGSKNVEYCCDTENFYYPFCYMSHGPKVVRKVWSEWVCEDRAVVPGIEISSFPRVQQVSCNAHVQIPETSASSFTLDSINLFKKKEKGKKCRNARGRLTFSVNLKCRVSIWFSPRWFDCRHWKRIWMQVRWIFLVGRWFLMVCSSIFYPDGFLSISF